MKLIKIMSGLLSAALLTGAAITGAGAQTASPDGCRCEEVKLDGSLSALVSGLTDSNAQNVRGELVSAYAGGKSFDMTDPGFVDAELNGTSDKNLSWAASSANILTVTGWAAKAGFADEDALMDAYASAYENKVNLADCGLCWFFDGYSVDEDYYLYDYTAKAKSGSGRYLPQYDAFSLIDFEISDYYNSKATSWKSIKDKLSKGYGVSLMMLDVPDGSDEDIMQPSLTVWGFVTDDRYPDTDSRHYKQLIISDGGSDMTGSKDRRTAPNRIRAVDIKEVVYSDEEYDDSVVTLEGYENSEIYGAICLAPYSDDLPYETSELATMNNRNSPDFRVDELTVSQITTADAAENMDYLLSDDPVTLFPDDTPLQLNAEIYNRSSKSYGGNVQVKCTVKDKSGNTVYTRTKSVRMTSDIKKIGAVNIGTLASGCYTAEVTVNPGGRVEEAYYYNNTQTFSFEVKPPVTDKTKLSFTAGEPRLVNNNVICDLHVEGLTDELLDKLVKCDVGEIDCTYTGEESFGMYDDIDMVQYNGKLPISYTLNGDGKFKLVLRISFEDAPAIYLESNIISNTFPTVRVNENYEDENFSFDDESYYVLSPVRKNSRTLAAGESVSFMLTLWSELIDEAEVKYHLEAVNKFGKRVALTNPEIKKVSYDDDLVITIAKFDNPIPSGEYVLRLAADNDVVFDDNFEYPYTIKVGSILEGDVNGDGRLTVDDATAVQKHLAGLITLEGDSLAEADVNGDGVVDINDVTTIQKVLSGEKLW